MIKFSLNMFIQLFSAFLVLLHIHTISAGAYDANDQYLEDLFEGMYPPFQNMIPYQYRRAPQYILNLGDDYAPQQLLCASNLITIPYNNYEYVGTQPMAPQPINPIQMSNRRQLADNTPSHSTISKENQAMIMKPHIHPSMPKPQPSNLNQFQNRAIIKPVETRRGISKPEEQYGKHVVPSYQQPPRKYANPFHNTAIVAPGRRNKIVNITPTQRSYTSEPLRLPYVQSLVHPAYHKPSYAFLYGRDKRDTREVKTNEKNAGLDLLQFKKSIHDHKIAGEDNIIRRILNKILSFENSA